MSAARSSGYIYGLIHVSDLCVTLQFLFDHLRTVLGHVGRNMMTSPSLATCFGPTLVAHGPPESSASILGINGLIQVGESTQLTVTYMCRSFLTSGRAFVRNCVTKSRRPWRWKNNPNNYHT